MKQGRKVTGGKYKKNRKKKFFEKQNQGRLVGLRETKTKALRVHGGNKKIILLSTTVVNVKVKDKVQKADIKNVVETPQNFFLARQNRLMKGAIIETSLGKARITNRPTQEGQVNAVLLE